MMMTNDTKPAHHKKTTRAFGTHSIMCWLSKSGYKCEHKHVDSVSIVTAEPMHNVKLDAQHNKSLGIFIRSRRRNHKSAGEVINAIEIGRLNKIKSICQELKCAPYFAFVADQNEKIYGFLTSLKHLQTFQSKKSKKWLHWYMKEDDLEKYRKDKNIEMFEFDYRAIPWT